MRLNFSNLGKGLEAIAGAKQARDLAEASKAFENNITEGAYGPALGENLQQVIGARDQALQGLGDAATPEQRQQVLDQYTPAMSELSRRVGLQAPDYSVGGAGVNYATRDQANIANAGLRAEALGKIYRQYGDVDRADALEARALEQRRGLAAELRAQEVEGRAQKQFETQNEAALLTIEEQRRQKKLRDDAEARQKKLSQDWSDRLATKDADGNVIGMRPPNDEDLMWSAQRNAQELAAAGKTQEALGAYKDFVIASEAQIKKQGVDRGEAIKRTAKLVNDGNYDALKDFYDKYVPDGAKVQEYKVNKDGTIIVKRVDLNGQPLPDAKTTKLELIQGLISFENPEKLATYAQQSFTNAMTSRQVAATESRAASANKMAGLNADLINARIDNLKARTTALNEPPKLTEAQVTQRARVMVTNRERNPATGKPYTMGEATEAVKAGKASNPIADALDRALGGNVDPFEAE